MVSKRPLTLAGLSMPIGTERVIIIKQEDGPARQRFTLAHEIAHLFLDEGAKQEVWRRTPTGAGQAANDKFESYCDRLAARILMPRAWLARDLKDKSLYAVSPPTVSGQIQGLSTASMHPYSRVAGQRISRGRVAQGDGPERNTLSASQMAGSGPRVE